MLVCENKNKNTVGSVKMKSLGAQLPIQGADAVGNKKRQNAQRCWSVGLLGSGLKLRKPEKGELTIILIKQRRTHSNPGLWIPSPWCACCTTEDTTTSGL